MTGKANHKTATEQPCVIYKAWTNLITGEVEIVYETATSGRILLEIFHCDGQIVKTIHSTFEVCGAHKVIWNGKDSSGTSMPNGVYTCRLITQRASVSKQFILAQ